VEVIRAIHLVVVARHLDEDLTARTKKLGNDREHIGSMRLQK
jgi:hypothetical protein